MEIPLGHGFFYSKFIFRNSD